MTTSIQKLKLFDFTMIVVGLVIGMGIFRTPVNVAKASPDMLVFFASWIVGGLIALCGALTYAEIGSRLPVTGGYYKVFSYAYHPSIAFAMNCVILISNAASLAAVTLVGGEYLTGIFMPADYNPAGLENLRMVIAMAAIFIFYLVNLCGLTVSASLQNVLMLIKISLILLLISPLFLLESFSFAAPLTSSAITPTLGDPIKAFGVGLVAVSFTYGGYQQTINFGAEVQQASKNVPLGIFLGISLIIALYLAINLAYVKVIGFETLKHSSNIAGIMGAKVFGENAERILSGFLFLSVLAYVNVLLLSNPRVMCAMSEDQILPAAFSKRHPKTDALTLSLTVFAGLSVLIVFWAKEFDTILSFTIFLDCFGMVLSAAAIFILRKRTPHFDGTDIYKMKYFPFMPLIFIVAYIFIAVSISLDYAQNGYAAAVGCAVMLLSLLVYFLLTQFNKRSLKQH